MALHDPRKIIDTLRNHLTHPDTNVAFLFGAGTSTAVRVPFLNDASEPCERALIPTVAELTATCALEIDKLDPQGEVSVFGSALASITAEVKPAHREANIEDILSGVQRKIEAIGEHDILCGLDKQKFALLANTIRRTIAAQVNPDPTGFPKRLPHADFVQWASHMPRAQAVELFTTNYDILLETALEAERALSFDGFVGCNTPFFCHETLARPEASPGSNWIRLWKVHGSINWQLVTIDGRKRVVRTTPQAEGEMIMPSHHKYDESRKQPYTALLDRLRKVMERDDTILFVCGYSFSDDHINTILFDALEARQRPHIIALQYSDPEDGGVLSERAKRLRNLIVLGPTEAIIRGEKAQWSAPDDGQLALIGNAFERLENGAVKGDWRGRLKLGDFAKFAGFAASLVGQVS